MEANTEKQLQTFVLNDQKSENQIQLDFPKVKELERGYWTNHIEYLLSMVGYAVGLGNAWRFPYIVYQNGGGAFLIPYFIMVVFVGFTMFFMEVCLGQFCSQSSVQAFNCVPILKGIGIAVVVTVCCISIYYNMVIGYAIHYFVLSFRSTLPWTSCEYEFSSNFCVETREELLSNNSCNSSSCKSIAASENYFENIVLDLSSGIEEPGKVKIYLLLELFTAWVLVCGCTIKGIKSVGKVVYITALFPYVILTILLLGSLQQDGSFDGIYYLFKPTWSTLITAKVWLEAANQILISLSLCVGGIICLSSYNEFHNNCFRDTIIVVLINSATSLYAAICIFSTLGFMAKKLNLNIEDVVSGGPGLAFVVYPEAAAQFSQPQLVSALFFFMLITLGLDSMFANVETIVTSMVDSAPHVLQKYKEWVTIGICLLLFLLGITLCTQGGFYWLILLDTYAGGYVLLWAGVFEVIIVAHIYGIKRFTEDIELMLKKKPPAIFGFVLYYITPVIFVSLAVSSAVQFQVLSYKGKKIAGWADGIGWLLIVFMILIVVIVAVIEVRSREGTLKKRIKDSLKPGKLWRPYKDENCTGRYALLVISVGKLQSALHPEKDKNVPKQEENSHKIASLVIKTETGGNSGKVPMFSQLENEDFLEKNPSAFQLETEGYSEKS